MTSSLSYKIQHKIGRYEIVELLGQGSMAIVYKAFDPYIDRTLAIKVLREERCIESDNRLRFLREAKAAGNLSHPHIVTIHDVGEFNDRPYIVMELLDGTPLDQLMDHDRSFSNDEAVDIGIQLANALDYAHKNGVIHRDIKPSNIICSTSSDNKLNVKITDFGIAHVSDSNLTQHTQTGTLLGTPYYISPEHVLGQTVDSRSDLFSLGVTLYQLFAGQRPFSGASLHTLLYLIATEEPRPICQVLPMFPLQLASIIDKLLQKQPKNRYQTGAEVAKALTDASNNISIKGPKKLKHRKISSALKSTLYITALLVLALMGIFPFVYSKFQETITAQTIKTGADFSNYIAHQNAEHVLQQDWLSVELFTTKVATEQRFQQLSITDYNGITRGDLNKDNLAKKSPLLEEAHLFNTVNQTRVYRTLSKNDIRIFGISIPSSLQSILGLNNLYQFYTPIIYHNREVGKVQLSLSLKESTQLTIIFLATLILLAIVSLGLIVPSTYILAARRTKAVSLIKESINNISTGNYSQRITTNRKDEMGEVYQAFNRMVDKLQQRDLKHKASNSTT